VASSHILRMSKLKGGGIVLTAAKHNKRTNTSHLANIDPLRSRLNYCLIGASTPQGVAAEAKRLMADAGIADPRKNGVIALEIVFSLPPNSNINHQSFFADSLTWLQGYFNVPVLSFDVHLDEAAPHAHAIILPLVNGKMNGSDLMGGPSTLAKMHSSFHQAVACKYGFKKPQRRLTGEAKKELDRLVMDAFMEEDLLLGSSAYSVIRESVRNNPEPYAECFGIALSTKKRRKRSRSAVEIMTQPVKSL
jgi:hypothetical protein